MQGLQRDLLGDVRRRCQTGDNADLPWDGWLHSATIAPGTVAGMAAGNLGSFSAYPPLPDWPERA